MIDIKNVLKRKAAKQIAIIIIVAVLSAIGFSTDLARDVAEETVEIIEETK
tara:strand:+ start:13004 stop:13156 length:153 start_codon:yes stop_codon:yes gene_type:complete